MKTIIFDIDGTLTNMWPIEKTVLLRMTNGKFEKEIEEQKKKGVSDMYTIFCTVSGKKIGKKKYVIQYNQSFLKLQNLPTLKKYPVVDWIQKNQSKYKFVYATGGQKLETEYVLTQLGIIKYFDLENSINKNNCRFSKKTGIPFRKIQAVHKNSLLITDSRSDYAGAQIAKIPSLVVKPGQKLLEINEGIARLQKLSMWR